jgi:integrase
MEVARLFERARERIPLAFRMMAATGVRDSEVLGIRLAGPRPGDGQCRDQRPLEDGERSGYLKTARSRRTQPLRDSVVEELRALRVFRQGFEIGGDTDLVLMGVSIDRLIRDFAEAARPQASTRATSC